MVIMYKMNAMTAYLAKKFVKHTAHFGMINLIMNERVVPELFQEEANVDDLVKELSQSIANRKTLQARLATAKDRLGNKGATERVAQALAPYLEGTI